MGMKAAVTDRYGPPEVIEIREVPTPVPGDNEILVRITVTTVNSGDSRVRGLNVPRGMTLMMRLALGWSGPKQKVGGFEGAGVVESVGAGITKFKPGDRVVGSHGFKFGLHAEYATFTEADALVPIPAGLTDQNAVAVLFGGSTARWFFKTGGLRAGHRVLINGASGAVGVMAIQLAKLAGAEVTGVCSSGNVDLVRSLGADYVFAYDREDFTRSGHRYDIIMDTHGNAPYAAIRHMLAPQGKLLMVTGDLFQTIAASWQNPVVASRRDDSEAVNQAAYSELVALAAAGELKPVIQTVLPFDRIVEAHRIVDGGHKRGSVLVRVAS
jgi:NADPH:quinone reductase-like Zn-dependent oxidoreductase